MTESIEIRWEDQIWRLFLLQRTATDLLLTHTHTHTSGACVRACVRACVPACVRVRENEEKSLPPSILDLSDSDSNSLGIVKHARARVRACVRACVRERENLLSSTLVWPYQILLFPIFCPELNTKITPS